jgi:hypothetical protein
VILGDKSTHIDQGGKIMVRYFYAWAPLFIVTAVVILSLPWLGLIALVVISLLALAALAFAFVLAPYMLILAISRRWKGQSGASLRTAPVLSPATQRPTVRKGYVS